MDNAKFESYEYVIGGKMVVGSVRMNESYMGLVNLGNVHAKNKLKQDLVQQMANFMLENKLVEFTRLQDPVTNDEIIRVRAYLAPDDQVKILRTASKLS